MSKNRPKVAVAMSGGVDSSLAAALLKEDGYDVIGLFAKTWTPKEGDGTACSWVADRRDALRVAAVLDIPLFTLDLEADYRAGVVGPMVEGYAQGLTPNPDVLCNRVVKFGALWRKAQELGAEFLATGHYARIETENSKQKTVNRKYRSPFTVYRLLRGVDTSKDQSYFLWDIEPSVLPHIFFPIGHLAKSEVRVLAERFGLPTASKPDSQGICFLGPTDLRTFLAHQVPAQSGPIRDITTGKNLGQHMGLAYLTIGQRHGVGTEVNDHQASSRYVVRLDRGTNTAWVGSKEDLLVKEVRLQQPNWLDETIAATLKNGSVTGSAQIRYRQSAVGVTIRTEGKQLLATFDEPVLAATPGQSFVLYSEEQLMGGAFITAAASAK